MEEKIEHKVNQVKAIPELSAACLKEGKSQELAMWLLLHLLSQELGGSPTVAYKYIMPFLTKYSWSISEVYRTLNSGNNIFWKCGTRKDGSLDALLFSRKVVVITFVKEGTISDFYAPILPEKLKPGRNLRAWIYASAIARYGNKPIARETIETHTGVCPRLQLIYEKITEVIVKETNSKWTDGDGNIRQLPNSYQYSIPVVKMRVLRDIRALYKSSVIKTRYTVYAAKKYFTKGIKELLSYLKKHPFNNWPVVYVATGKEDTAIKSLQTWRKYKGRVYYTAVLLKDASMSF